MSFASSPAPARSASLFSAFVPLLPLTLTVFVAFFAMGMALATVPRHVHGTLGMSAFWVGVVMGSQFFASMLLGRAWSGSVTDARGSKPALLAGLVGVAAVGLVYFGSLAFVEQPALSLKLLIAGRLLTGVAEPFVITAALAWGIARVGPAHAGKVIGWIGLALFMAYGVGAPAGAAVFAQVGFAGVAAATVGVPLAALFIALRIRGGVPGNPGLVRPPFYKVLGFVKLPGLALTLCSLGYAAINAFVVLLFAERGWGNAALAFTSLGAGFVLARLLVGHLPDQLGGARVALVCVLVEALGQLLIWGAPGPVLACLGAALTGAGYALAFQGFGVEAVHRAPPQSRGAAMSGYVVFQDVAMGLAGPLGGWLALRAGTDAIYLAGAAGAVASGLLALAMMRSPAVDRSGPSSGG